ncbi:MAG: glycerophosphodiester phosphodiesterase [Ferruginibacter sp.]
MFIIISAVLFFVACKKDYQAPVPDLEWDLFNSSAASKLSDSIRQKIEGVYNIEEGQAGFGVASALKWSYTITGTDTSYFLSFFCAQDVSYIICEGKRLDSSILLNGYWRKMINTETGKVQLTISAENGAAAILSGRAITSLDTIKITGFYGFGNGVPGFPLQLRHVRPINKAKPFEIIAHRGGGRSSDLLPASENSAELIRLASKFGATGIEIDVRLTSDGVPVLFHDATLNERVIQKNGLLGPIENYTYAQLNTLVRLTNGERIPTLREALNAALFNTPLHYVWLDTKFKGSIQQVRDMQKEFLQKSDAMGRGLNISIGIPDEGVRDNFLLLKDYAITPAVCELSLQDVAVTHAGIWAPRWTLGLQNDEVNDIHAQGKKAFVWTLDTPENIEQYISKGNFDGMLSNYPSVVAYYYYAQQ